jgi:hypothetical protein
MLQAPQLVERAPDQQKKLESAEQQEQGKAYIYIPGTPQGLKAVDKLS